MMQRKKLTTNHFLLLLAGLLSSCSSENTLGDLEVGSKRIETREPKTVEYGFCHAGYSQTDAEYQLLEDLGAEWIRIDISWKRVEPEPGRWQFDHYDALIGNAHKRGIRILAVLGFDTEWTRSELDDEKRRIHPKHVDDFLEYAERVTARYGTQLGAVEIWNEPNLPRFWGGTDEEFYRLTKLTAERIRAQSPWLPIGVGSVHISPFFGGKSFLRGLIESDCFEHADALAVHPYGRNTSRSAAWISDALDELEHAGIDAELWVTEVGFPTESMFPYRVALDDHYDIVKESLEGLSESGASLITWYKLFSDKEWEKEAGPFDGASFGLVWKNENGEFEWKPGAYAFREVARGARNGDDD